MTTKAPFTVKEAAGELGVSATLVRKLIHSGQLVAYNFGPRKTVVYRKDLEAFREGRKVKTSSKREAS